MSVLVMLYGLVCRHIFSVESYINGMRVCSCIYVQWRTANYERLIAYQLMDWNVQWTLFNGFMQFQQGIEYIDKYEIWKKIHESANK